MATPKLNEKEWANVRAHWERDKREGFTWVVKELCLPVSPNGVKKKANQAGWKKISEPHEPAAKSSASRKAGSALVARTRSEPKSEPREPATDEITPFKTRETPTLDQLDEDEPRQGLFVREYVKDLNGTQAAIRTGYSVDSARSQAADLLTKPNIQAAICELRDETLRKLEASVEELVRYWLDILRADPNAITSYRRHCCPYCWGKVAEDGYRRAKQLTPAQYDAEHQKHHEKRAMILEQTDQAVDIGEFASYEGDWFDRRRPINPECPECHGNGVETMHIADTRNLPPGVAALFNGVEKTDKGIKILMSSKEKAADQLGRFLGVFKDREINVEVTMPNVNALEDMFQRGLADAQARQQKINDERGIIIDVTPDGEAEGLPGGA